MKLLDATGMKSDFSDAWRQAFTMRLAFHSGDPQGIQPKAKDVFKTRRLTKCQLSCHERSVLTSSSKIQRTPKFLKSFFRQKVSFSSRNRNAEKKFGIRIFRIRPDAQNRSSVRLPPISPISSLQLSLKLIE